MKRKITLLSVALMVAALSAVLTWCVLGWEPRPPASAGTSTTTAGPSLGTIRGLSALTALKIEVSDALVTELRGRTGGTKAVVLVRGEALVGVDLSAAQFLSVDQDKKAAVLQLPLPTVQSARLDHARTKLLGVWTDGLWAITPGGQEADATTVNAAYQEAECTVAAAAADVTLIARARAQAETVLRTFVEALGWTLQVRWADGA